jgi:hypothetical protein
MIRNVKVKGMKLKHNLESKAFKNGKMRMQLLPSERLNSPATVNIFHALETKYSRLPCSVVLLTLLGLTLFPWNVGKHVQRDVLALQDKIAVSQNDFRVKNPTREVIQLHSDVLALKTT